MLTTLLALTLAQAPGAGAPSGQFLLNGVPVQQVMTQLVTYYGDCPGEGQNDVRGVSFITPIQPAPYQRIVITNTSTGGFTDREYDERRPSAEAFSMALGMGQRGSALTLTEGLNTFTYTVRNRVSGEQLGQGSATLMVGVQRLSANRGFSQIKVDRYCLGEKYGGRNLDQCRDGLITVERTGVCPGGSTRTLTLETVRQKTN